MTQARMSQIETEELVERFVDLSLQQGRALYLLESSATINRLGETIH